MSNGSAERAIRRFQKQPSEVNHECRISACQLDRAGLCSRHLPPSLRKRRIRHSHPAHKLDLYRVALLRTAWFGFRAGNSQWGAMEKCDGKFSCSPATVADALPLHRVYVDGFWMDATDVTNAEFEKFVKATGYVTIAERTPTKEEVPHCAAGEPCGRLDPSSPPQMSGAPEQSYDLICGVTSTARTGGTRKVRRATSRAGKTIRLCKSPTPMR